MSYVSDVSISQFSTVQRFYESKSSVFLGLSASRSEIEVATHPRFDRNSFQKKIVFPGRGGINENTVLCRRWYYTTKYKNKIFSVTDVHVLNRWMVDHWHCTSLSIKLCEGNPAVSFILALISTEDLLMLKLQLLILSFKCNISCHSFSSCSFGLTQHTIYKLIEMQVTGYIQSLGRYLQIPRMVHWRAGHHADQREAYNIVTSQVHIQP